MPRSPHSESHTGAFARVTSQELNTWLHDGQELALIDIHEAGEYGEGHLLLAANIPWSELELQITRRVPRQNTRLVLVSPAALAPLAVRALTQLGYQQVYVLDGGTPAWAAAGLPVFKGIYVPSKAFAECVELARHTTTIEADALHALLEKGEDVVVLDSRTAKEYARFHVPGAISCPGSELLLRLDSLVPSPATHVVISCAGRTRGIMGGQTLVDAQVPHRISVLAGGTQGWKLAGYEVEQSAPAALPEPGAEAAGLAGRRAQALSQSLDIPVIDRKTLAQWQADAQRTTVLLDVRDPSEAQATPITDAIAVAGVQLLQTTDTVVSVHGARLVLADGYGVRSHTTAYWLQQQGWEVAVLAPEDTFAHANPTKPASSNAALRAQALLRSVSQLDARQAAQWLADGAAIVSVQSSEGFEQVRIPKSVWSHRAAIATGALDGIQALKGLCWLVVAEDAGIGALAALQLQQRLAAAQTVAVFVLDAAGQQALVQQGVVLDRQAQALAPAQRVDFLYWLHDRHLGNAEASRQYLAWEAQLPTQIGDQRQARFRISLGAAQQV